MPCRHNNGVLRHLVGRIFCGIHYSLLTLQLLAPHLICVGLRSVLPSLVIDALEDQLPGLLDELLALERPRLGVVDRPRGQHVLEVAGSLNPLIRQTTGANGSTQSIEAVRSLMVERKRFATGTERMPVSASWR